ncbi:MAG TPA: hypothetical protein VFV99_19950, partial [Kofleriaceae bacterium]|nr:hypothetical protein [Kofleriaceae bacterium]
TRGKVDKKIGAATLEMLRLAQPRVDGPAAAEIAALIAELEQKVGASAKAAAADANRFAKLAQAKGASWAGDVGKLLVDIGNEKNRAAIEQVCKVVLASPAAIAHKQWPALVTKALKLSKTYGDVTEATYGERLTVAQMENDEGGAMDYYADDHLYTFDWLLLTLATPAAIANPAWPGLVLALCEAKAKAVGYYSFGDDEVCALLAVPEATQHPRFGELVLAARAAFPFASCFGANGALRDYQMRLKSPRASTVVNWPPEPPRPAQPAAPEKAPAKNRPRKAPEKKGSTKAPAKKGPTKAPTNPARAPKRVPAKKPAKAKRSARAAKRR